VGVAQHKQQGRVEAAGSAHSGGRTLQTQKQQQQSLSVSSKMPSSSSLVSTLPSPAVVAASSTERDSSAESLAAFCSSLEQLEPRSVALGLQPQHMLGVAVQGV
jgi:hypothetical protein